MKNSNERVAAFLLRLHDFLVIGGYDEVHARPYARLGQVIAQHPEDVEILAKERSLKRIPRLGWKIERTIMEFLKTGTSEKFEEFARRTPVTVMDLLEIPGVGVKTARALFLSFNIDSPAALKQSLDEGWLEDLGVFKPNLLSRIRRHLEETPE